MSRNQLFAVRLVIILMIFSGASSGQSWSGVLDPTRATDWTKAGAGAIPDRPSPSSNCTTLNP